MVQSTGQFACVSPDLESQKPSLLQTAMVGATIVGFGTPGVVGLKPGTVGCTVGCGMTDGWVVGTTGWTGQSCKAAITVSTVRGRQGTRHVFNDQTRT